MMTKEMKIFAAMISIALLLCGIAGYLFLSKPKVIGLPVPLDIPRETLVPTWSAVFGNPSAPFTLVEFGDYECPACRTMASRVEELVAGNPGKLNNVFHHCVRVDDHPEAKWVAMAAFAAGEQGKLSQMHSALYKHQYDYYNSSPSELSDKLIRIAREVGLDIDRFNRDRGSPKAAESIDRMEKLASTLKVSVTPTFVLVQPAGKPILFRSIADMEYWLKKLGISK